MPLGYSRTVIAEQFFHTPKEQKEIADYIAHRVWREVGKDRDLCEDCEQAAWLALCDNQPISTMVAAKLHAGAAIKREKRSWIRSRRLIANPELAREILGCDSQEDDYSEESFA